MPTVCLNHGIWIMILLTIFLRRTCLILPNRIRSEEHTSELQSHSDSVCRLLLEKKNKRWDREKLTSEQREALNASTYRRLSGVEVR